MDIGNNSFVAAGGRSYWYGSGSVSHCRELSDRLKGFVGYAHM